VSSYYGSDVGTHGGAGSQLCSATTYGRGYPTLSIDEMGMKHQEWSDGLRRVIEVDEPDTGNNLTIGTCHAYDALGNVVQTVQGSQTRNYAYDMLSARRLRQFRKQVPPVFITRHRGIVVQW